MPFRKIPVEDGREQADVRNATSSLGDSVIDVTIVWNEDEKADVVVINLNDKLPAPLFADISMCNLETRGVHAFECIEGGTEDFDGHYFDHYFG